MRTDTRTWLIIVAAVLIAFLVGYGWQRFRAGGIAEELRQSEHALEVQRIEATLAVAAVEALSGSYEIARQHASEFFTALQAELERMPEPVRPPMSELLARRDAMITALSRNDVQAGPQLAQMLRRYRAALGEPVGPGSGMAPAPVTPLPADSPAAPPAADSPATARDTAPAGAR